MSDFLTLIFPRYVYLPPPSLPQILHLVIHHFQLLIKDFNNLSRQKRTYVLHDSILLGDHEI